MIAFMVIGVLATPVSVAWGPAAGAAWVAISLIAFIVFILTRRKL